MNIGNLKTWNKKYKVIKSKNNKKCYFVLSGKSREGVFFESTSNGF